MWLRWSVVGGFFAVLFILTLWDNHNKPDASSGAGKGRTIPRDVGGVGRTTTLVGPTIMVEMGADRTAIGQKLMVGGGTRVSVLSEPRDGFISVRIAQGEAAGRSGIVPLDSLKP